MLLYLAVIIGLISFLLMTSYYKGSLGTRPESVLQRGESHSAPIVERGSGNGSKSRERQ